MIYHQSVFNFVTYCLVTSEKELKQVRKKFGIPKSDIPVKHNGARVNYLEFEVGALVVVQMLDLEHPLHEVIALLAHECIHIKQYVMQSIGEKYPSDEFEAYFVQDLVAELTKELLEKIL